MTGRRRKPGRMGPFIEGYRAWLAGRGYTPGTIVGMLAMAGGLGRWMDARGIAPGDLDRAAVTEFRDALRAAGRRWVPGAHGLDRLLEYLEDQGVLGGSLLACGTGRGAGGTLSPVAGDRPRAGRGHGRALCEAGALVPEPASDRPGRAGEPVRRLTSWRSCWPKANGSASARSRAGWASCARC